MLSVFRVKVSMAEYFISLMESTRDLDMEIQKQNWIFLFFNHISAI